MSTNKLPSLGLDFGPIDQTGPVAERREALNKPLPHDTTWQEILSTINDPQGDQSLPEDTWKDIPGLTQK